MFQVITPIPGFDFGWGPHSSLEPSSVSGPKYDAYGTASRPVW